MIRVAGFLGAVAVAVFVAAATAAETDEAKSAPATAAGADAATQLTIYNQNFATVKERRTLELSQGEGEVRVTDITAHLEPDSVVLRGTTGNDRFDVLADRFEVDGVAFRALGAKQVRLEGLAGNDTYAVSALPLPLTISDTAGVDVLDFSAASHGVTVSLASSYAQKVFGSGNTLTLKGTIESLIGTNYADVLRGNSATSQTLWGLGGDDTIYGGSGSSVLVGGEGNDLLVGGYHRNVLIGGLGQDTLKAGSGGDVLIGGQTIYDESRTDLLAILQRDLVRIDFARLVRVWIA